MRSYATRFRVQTNRVIRPDATRSLPLRPMHPVLAKLQSFLPRGHSALVFTVAMACYSRTAGSFVHSLVHLIDVRPPPENTWESPGLILLGAVSATCVAPVVESLVLVGAIELLRWLRAPRALQVLLAAALLAAPHSLKWWPHALIVMPAFTLEAVSYLYWRPTSFKRAVAVVIGIHAMSNVIPALFEVGKVTGRW